MQNYQPAGDSRGRRLSQPLNSPILKGSPRPTETTYKTKIVMKPEARDELFRARVLVEGQLNTRVSNSLLYRRAMRVYLQQLEALHHQPGGWKAEIQRIREAR